jgi:hypothetical protein
MTEPVQWEYQVNTIGKTLGGLKDDEAAAFLNELGEAGWEVIGIYPIENSNKVRLVAKRLLTAATRRQRSMPMI